MFIDAEEDDSSLSDGKTKVSKVRGGNKTESGEGGGSGGGGGRGGRLGKMLEGT